MVGLSQMLSLLNILSSGLWLLKHFDMFVSVLL